MGLNISSPTAARYENPTCKPGGSASVQGCLRATSDSLAHAQALLDKIMGSVAPVPGKAEGCGPPSGGGLLAHSQENAGRAAALVDHLHRLAGLLTDQND